MPIDLSSRLSNLKATHDTNRVSDDKTPTPLWVVLYIHTRSTNVSYKGYMEGVKKLIEYLAPIEMPTHTTLDENYHVPDILRTYEMTKLAELLVPRAKMSDEYLGKIRRAEKAILYSMYREVIPLLY